MAGPVKTFTEGSATIGINVTSVVDVTKATATTTQITLLGVTAAGSPVTHVVSGDVPTTIAALNT